MFNGNGRRKTGSKNTTRNGDVGKSSVGGGGGGEEREKESAVKLA